LLARDFSDFAQAKHQPPFCFTSRQPSSVRPQILSFEHRANTSRRFGLILNLIYIPLVKERGLAKRFGDDYLLYKRNVPRWIRRLTPWEGLSDP
jgi:hypothetical protein